MLNRITDKSPHKIVGKKPEKAGRSFLDMFAGHGGFSLVEIAPTKVDCLIMPVVEVDEVRKLAPPLSITQSEFTDERRHLEKRTWWKEFHPKKTDTIPTKEHWERRYTPPKLSGYKRDISPFYLTPPRITQEDNKITINSIMTRTVDEVYSQYLVVGHRGCWAIGNRKFPYEESPINRDRLDYSRTLKIS